MKILVLKNHIAKLEKNKLQIIKYWIGDKKVFSILKKRNISPEYFIKNYAINFLNYYNNFVKNFPKYQNLVFLKDLIEFLKDKEVSKSELFIIFNRFKNSLIECTYELKLNDLELQKNINSVFEIIFITILEKYSNPPKLVEKKFEETVKLLDKYLLTSSTNLEGKIISASTAFCKLSGFSKKELLGNNHSLVRHPDMKEEIIEDLWLTIKAGNTWRGKLRNRKKDDSTYWLNATISSNYDEEGQFISYDAIYEDITAKVELEEQENLLVEQSKAAAMGEMISMIAHQWRQPLQAVSILNQKVPLSKALDGEVSDELLEQVSEGITKQLEYMSKTIDDFRDFFLPNRVQESFPVTTIVNKALDFLAYMIKADSISINLEVKSEAVILVHVNELVQVLINLVKNARDILIERKIDFKELNISIFEDDLVVVIEIEDNAGGIPEEIKNKIFEPYFSTKDNKNGTGLGLYMCKTIVEKHSSGSLTARNSDKGAVFRIELPK